jgi:hypothetical protein
MAGSAKGCGNLAPPDIARSSLPNPPLIEKLGGAINYLRGDAAFLSRWSCVERTLLPDPARCEGTSEETQQSAALWVE